MWKNTLRRQFSAACPSLVGPYSISSVWPAPAGSWSASLRQRKARPSWTGCKVSTINAPRASRQSAATARRQNPSRIASRFAGEASFGNPPRKLGRMRWIHRRWFRASATGSFSADRGPPDNTGENRGFRCLVEQPWSGKTAPPFAWPNLDDAASDQQNSLRTGNFRRFNREFAQSKTLPRFIAAFSFENMGASRHSFKNKTRTYRYRISGVPQARCREHLLPSAALRIVAAGALVAALGTDQRRFAAFRALPHMRRPAIRDPSRGRHCRG